MKNNTLAIALASLLVGGVAVAAFQNNRRQPSRSSPRRTRDTSAGQSGCRRCPRRRQAPIPSRGKVEYAQVVNVDPITEKQQLYAQVIGTEPVRETSTTSTPHQVCNDVVVQERRPSAIAQRRRHGGRRAHRWPGRQPGRRWQWPQAGDGRWRGRRRLRRSRDRPAPRRRQDREPHRAPVPHRDFDLAVLAHRSPTT